MSASVEQLEQPVSGSLSINESSLGTSFLGQSNQLLAQRILVRGTA
jgi:hypothetical protein